MHTFVPTTHVSSGARVEEAPGDEGEEDAAPGHAAVLDVGRAQGQGELHLTGVLRGDIQHDPLSKQCLLCASCRVDVCHILCAFKSFSCFQLFQMCGLVCACGF